MLENQVEAWNKGDLEGFMEGYWRSPDLTFYSEDRPRRGWDQTFARYKERYGDGGKEMGKLSFSNLKIDMLGERPSHRARPMEANVERRRARRPVHADYETIPRRLANHARSHVGTREATP